MNAILNSEWCEVEETFSSTVTYAHGGPEKKFNRLAMTPFCYYDSLVKRCEYYSNQQVLSG